MHHSVHRAPFDSSNMVTINMDREIGMIPIGKVAIYRVVVATFILLMLVAPTVVAAEEATVQLGIVPVDVEGNYFSLEMSPGETQQLSVQLTNHAAAAITAYTFPADAYTLVNGGFGARLAQEPMTGVTRWIDYQIETLDLQAGETVLRTFNVTVPEDAEPGKYLTSLVIQNAEAVARDEGGGVGFTQTIRQVIAVAITVPGPSAPGIAIGQSTHSMVAGQSVFSTEVMNTGNLHLVPNGGFTLTDAEGAEIASLPLTMAVVYAQTETLVEAALPELLPAGDYTVNLWLEDPEHDVRAESGALLVVVPELVAPEVVPAQDPAAVTAPVVETQLAGIPTWALLVAIPSAIILGALIAVGVVLGLRRRSKGANAPQPARSPQQVITREVPPPAPARKQATVRQMMPPAPKVNQSASQGDFD
ncbi:hypothetical protein BH23CHL1_BH23CHL1_20880 [soil metagenome]